MMFMYVSVIDFRGLTIRTEEIAEMVNTDLMVKANFAVQTAKAEGRAEVSANGNYSSVFYDGEHFSVTDNVEEVGKLTAAKAVSIIIENLEGKRE